MRNKVVKIKAFSGGCKFGVEYGVDWSICFTFYGLVIGNLLMLPAYSRNGCFNVKTLCGCIFRARAGARDREIEEAQQMSPACQIGSGKQKDQSAGGAHLRFGARSRLLARSS